MAVEVDGGPRGDGSAGSPLRVGLLLDGLRAPAWVYAVVEDVAASPHATLELAVLRRDPAPRPEFLRRLWHRRRHLVYELYARLDRRLFRGHPDAFARRDLAPLLAGVPVLEVTPRTTRFTDALEEGDLEAVRGHRPDVLLRFGFRILRGGLLTVARHGVWSYHHDDNRVIRGGPPGFWEVMEGHPVTGSMLQVLGDRLDAGRVIYRSWSSTHRRSVQRSRQPVYWKSSAFVGRCLATLATTGDPATGPAAGPEEGAFHPYSDRLHRKPGNLRAASLLLRHAARSGIGWATDRWTRNQWFLAFALDGTEDDDPAPPELFRFHTVLPPRDRFWADPFPVRHGDRHYVFLEEYLYRAGRGHLAVMEIGADGTWSSPRPVLEAPHHLSYPFIFPWRGEWFLVPESAEAGRVELFRSRAFPGDWIREAVLLDGVEAVDPTLHQDDDGWWLFVNQPARPGASRHDELHLYFADAPTGPWTPHPTNPVVSDVRCARPAGRLFRWRGDLYRPAQDCGRRYGHAVQFRRIRRLDRHGYREEPATRIEPRWFPGLLATHTFNRGDGLTVVDGMRGILHFGAGPPPAGSRR